jgi:hypothetical protein
VTFKQGGLGSFDFSPNQRKKEKKKEAFYPKIISKYHAKSLLKNRGIKKI